MMTPAYRHIRRGFTLIEMVMVIGIIVLLAALTITVGSGITQRSEVDATRTRLELMTTALNSWEVAKDRSITYGINGEPPTTGLIHKYEVDQTLNPYQATEKLFALISRNKDVQDTLSRIRSDFIEEDVFEDPTLGDFKTYIITDSWDEQILAVFPGREWVDSGSYTRDDDGTIRTPIEEELGVAVNRQIYFVSAGPDGEFGELNGTGGDLEDTEDNIYSYEVIRP